MATKPRSWRRWVLLAVAGVAAWQAARLFIARRASTQKLINQLWVERMPAHPRDMVWHFLAIDQDGRHLGAIGQASRWRVHTDGFIWRQQGDEITFVTPQNRCKSTLKARTWKCAGEAPKPFDLCLELASKDKRFRYYSRREWVIRPGGHLEGDDLPAAGAPVVQAALAASGDERGGDDREADAAGCTVGPW
jgi:hypothetical protein